MLFAMKSFYGTIILYKVKWQEILSAPIAFLFQKGI